MSTAQSVASGLDWAIPSRPVDEPPIARLTAEVLVVGAGNAGLCAALAARRRGADVLVLERASKPWRGGNSKYTRNIRCAHDDGDPIMPGRYSPDELLADLQAVTGEGSDPELTGIAIERSAEAPGWMERNGIRWQPAMRGTLQLGRTNRFFLGGGKALINTYHRTCERLGVRVAYDSTVASLRIEGGRCVEVEVLTPRGRILVAPRAVVVAAGGFEANIEWLREYWGDAADNYSIRGSRQNDGLVLRALLDCGAVARGNPRGFHAIAVDERSPQYEGGIVTRVDAIPFGIVVNRDGVRFADEGEDLWPRRYATWGGLLARQPGQTAYVLFDSQVVDRFIPAIFPPYRADSVQSIAERIGAPTEAVLAAVAEYNDAAGSPGVFDPSRLDGCATTGLAIPKSNWALPIARPPFYAYPLRPGITFTYLGVGIDADARILRAGGDRFENVFAAGEIMAGNILLRGYLAGFGMTIGTVFGHIAGEEAARHVLA